MLKKIVVPFDYTKEEFVKDALTMKYIKISVSKTHWLGPRISTILYIQRKRSLPIGLPYWTRMEKTAYYTPSGWVVKWHMTGILSTASTYDNIKEENRGETSTVWIEEEKES